MKKIGFITLFVVLTVGFLPAWCRSAASIGSTVIPPQDEVSIAKGDELSDPGDAQGRTERKGEVDLLPFVLALNESLMESRATVEELEARVEKLEKITMDIAPDSPPRMFFNVANEGVKVYSWATNDAITVKRTAGNNNGLAYDSSQHKLYWNTNYTIYRGNRDDDKMEVVFNSTRYGNIRGLAHDWITGNLYGVSSNGIVFVCNTSSIEKLDCEVLLSDPGDLFSIALNPTDGKMYWTTGINGTIRWAEMDGSDPAMLLSGLSNPRGITIDFDASRLYWADYYAHQIQSSDLAGKENATILTVSSPWGIATREDRVYFGTEGTNRFQSVTKAGEDVRTLYDGVNQVHQLVLATNNLPRSRKNHCEYYNCSRICVLTASYARCVD